MALCRRVKKTDKNSPVIMALNCRELNGYGDRESALCVRQWVLIQDHLFICLVLLSVCAFETRPQRKVRDQRCDLNYIMNITQKMEPF